MTEQSTLTTAGVYTPNGSPGGSANTSASPFYSPEIMPRNVSDRIWQKARELSIFPSLSTNVPVILGENDFPTLTRRPSATIVGEGENKSASDIRFGHKTMRPIKAIVGLEFTMEAVMKNPHGVLGLMEAELSGALARQVDLAIAHGRDATTGDPIDSLSGRSLAALATEVGQWDDEDPDLALWDAYSAVIDAGNDFTGFAFDPRFVHNLATYRDADGRRVHTDLTMGSAGLSSYSGQRAATSKTVSGQVDAAPDSGIRAFAGDWDALKFGYVADLKTRKIEYGDPFGNGDLQRRNSVAYLTEVIFGFLVMEDDAFAKIVPTGETRPVEDDETDPDD